MWPKLFLVAGAIGTFAPKKCVNTLKQLLLWPSYENPEALEPRDWVVAVFRIQSLIALLVGVYAVVQSTDEQIPPIPNEPDLTPSKSE